jgi:hypothetical protein
VERYISSGCSAVSHTTSTTFHDSPRRRSTLDGRALGASAPGTSIYTSRAPNYPVHCPGPSSPPAMRRPRAHACQRTAPSLHASQGAWGRPGRPWGPRTAAPAPLVAQRPNPSSPIPSPPRRLPSAHLSLPTGECSGPTGTASQGPRAPPPSLGEARPEGKRPHAQGQTPWSPRPLRAQPPAARQIPSAHHASHQRPIEPPGQGPRPGPCRVARCQEATVPSHHCHFAAPPLTRRPHNRAPGKVERASPRPRAVAPAMPCHPPHRPSRTSPIQTHRASLASNRARKRSAVPTRFSGAHNHTHKVGLRRPAGQVLPSPPSLPTGENRGWAIGAAPLGHPVPGTTTPRAPRGPAWASHHRRKPSARLRCCQLAKDRAHWNRTRERRRAPGTHDSYLDLNPRRPRPTSGSSSQLATGLRCREAALEHP